MSRRSGAFDALVLAPEAPYPVIGGGPSRTASLVEYLTQRGRRVHVVTFLEPGAPDSRPFFPANVRVDVISLRPHTKSWQARFGRNLQRAARGVPPLIDRFSKYEDCLREYIAGQHYELAVIDHFWCAPYAHLLRQHCTRLLLNLHNIDSLLLERCAVLEPFPSSLLHRRFASCCRVLEVELLPLFDVVLAPSAEDAGRLSRRAVVYPNAIPLAELPRVRKSVDLVFSGNLEYSPNRDAVRWFSREVWPGLRRAYPNLTWSIVGRNHQKAENQTRLAGVSFTGPIADALAAIACARVAIVPVRAGSGTRVKILEAWAAGLPVVSTSLGAEGLPANGGISIADTAGDFGGAILELLQGGAEEQGTQGRAVYEQSYNWPAVWQILDREGL